MLDLRVLNGLVVSDGAAVEADVGIEGGKITDVVPAGALGAATSEINASGLYVLPGAIDAHFHCRAPSHPERGDFASETQAAAAGGVTTIFEMPISDPACSTPEVFRARRELGESQCYVNFALFAGGAVKTAEQATAMAECGAIGFKLFTHSPSPHRAHEFEGLWAVTEDAIFEALSAIQTTGLVCTVHAENEALLQAFSHRADRRGNPMRPPVVEATEIALLGALAAAAGTEVHIAHVTSQAALAAVRGASVTGARITSETCPQYLVFDSGLIDRVGAFAKVAPPLRELEDTLALWEGLRDGSISMVASDHAPFLPEEKHGTDYTKAPQGLPTVETMVPILLDAASRRRLPLELAVDLITRRPAERFDLYPEKGRVGVGADADIMLFDPRGTTRLSVRSLRSRAAGSGLAYEGMVLQGRVVQTIVAGRTVYRDGKIVDPPTGRFVHPHRFPAWRPA
jgi:allantoinase